MMAKCTEICSEEIVSSIPSHECVLFLTLLYIVNSLEMTIRILISLYPGGIY